MPVARVQLQAFYSFNQQPTPRHLVLGKGIDQANYIMHLYEHTIAFLKVAVPGAIQAIKDGRLTYLLVPFFRSRILLINLIKFSAAGLLVQGAALLALTFAFSTVCAGISLIGKKTTCDKLVRQWERGFRWIQGPGNGYARAIVTIFAGPIGLIIMRNVGVQDPQEPTMLYLACMGLVGSVVVDIIKPIFEEVSKLGNLPEQRRSNVPPYTYTVPNVRQPTVYYDDETSSWFTLH